jgi:hypothetical protein
MQGPVQFVVVLAGWLQLVACVHLCAGGWLLPGCGAPLLFWSPLELAFPPLELVLPPLECALLAMLLGLHDSVLHDLGLCYLIICRCYFGE